MTHTVTLGDNTLNCQRCHGISKRNAPSTGSVNAMEARMTSMIKTLALIAVMATPAFAQVPLSQEQHINDSLVAGQVGDTIRKTCPSISAKMFVVLGKLNDLEDYDREKGYSEAEVKAFLKDKSEKARIKALAKDYLTAAGAVEGDPESYCTVGRAEIEKGTLAGSLLRSWK